MAEMWYYTNEGKQMDPVSMKELKRLVGDGVLKPTDMVWKDGMPRWIRASSVAELFPDPSSSLDRFFTNTAAPEGAKTNVPPAVVAASAASSAVAAGKPAPVADAQEPRERKKRQSAAETDAEDRRKPPRRRAEPAGGGSNLGIILALIIGGVVVVLALVVGIVILAFVFHGGGDRPKENVPLVADNGPVNNNDHLPQAAMTYNVEVNPRQTDRRSFHFQRGVEYSFSVRTQPRNPDVDLYVLDRNGLTQKSDASIGPDSNLRWTPNQEGEYRIEVRNRSAVTRARSIVSITPAPRDAGNVEPALPPPLPPGVREGKSSFDTAIILPGRTYTVKFRVKGGHAASVNVTPLRFKATTDINVFVVRDSNGVTIASDTRPDKNANVAFNVPETEIVQVRILNNSRTGTYACTVIYDVSP